MDIALTFEPGTLVSDVLLSRGDLIAEKDLETAITISLFTDRRARVDDPLEANESRRGWWGDTYAEIEKDQIGSRLWLLRREKILDSVLTRAKQYAEEAVQWLIEDRVAQNIKVETEVVGPRANGVLGIRLEVTRPNSIQTFKFQYAWDQL